MASDLTAPFIGTGTTTPVIRTDEVGGKHYQVIKLAHGAAGAATMVSIADPEPVASTPLSSASFCPTSAVTNAYAASKVVKASGGALYWMYGHNSGPTQYIQVHNATSLPANGAVPSILIVAAAGANFVLEFSKFGIWFPTGIVLCNSSTGPTKTIGAADCWFGVLFA